MLNACTRVRATPWRPLAALHVPVQRGAARSSGTQSAFTSCPRPSAASGGLGWSKLARWSCSSAKPTDAELHRQVAELSSVCVGLATQVQNLTKLIEEKNSKNLLELQAAKGISSNRKHFRPTLDMVANQVNHVSQLENDTLVLLAIRGDGFARRERLLREIMQVDACSWDDAHEKLIEMDNFCEERYWIHTFPYRLGISAAILCTVGSVLLVFNKTAAHLYGVNVAGEKLPDDVEDISDMTYNQVGTWTWSWMEPMIGTASFVLLCLQFGRAQSVKMNMNPYTEAMMKWRANRVANQYPQYDGSIVRLWTKQLPTVGWNFMPRYRRRIYTPEMRTQNLRGGL